MNGFDKYRNGEEATGNMLISFNKARHYVLLFGVYEDAEGKWQWKKDYYGERPTRELLKADIDALVNAQTDEKILGGLVWRNYPVWLAQENQMNIKAVYDFAFQTGGSLLPIRFKLGENAAGEPQYFDFDDMETFGEFYSACVEWIHSCISAGWQEKDSVDYDSLLSNN